MERITPNDSQTFTNNDGNKMIAANADPFGDSFTNFSVNLSLNLMKKKNQQLIRC